MHVDDVAEAMVLALEEKEIEGEIINLGTRQTRKMKENLSTIKKEVGADKKDVVPDKNRLRPKDVKILVGDNSKARKILGWNPKTRFDEGIQRTVSWYIDEGKMWGYEKRKWHWRY